MHQPLSVCRSLSLSLALSLERARNKERKVLAKEDKLRERVEKRGEDVHTCIVYVLKNGRVNEANKHGPGRRGCRNRGAADDGAVFQAFYERPVRFLCFQNYSFFILPLIFGFVSVLRLNARVAIQFNSPSCTFVVSRLEGIF